jgi:two-component system, OmpR family, response regulator TrcR
MHKIKLLLVEDEATLGLVIKETLEQQGFDIVHSSNGVEGWDIFKSFNPDICVVDIMMPRKDGLSLVEDIRSVNQHVPVIFLTAKSQTDDVILGFKTGADDYIKKPFSMEELLLRIKALLKRSTQLLTEPASEEIKQTDFAIGHYQLRYTRNELVYDHSIIKLSQRETDLLKMLVIAPNEIVLRKDVLLKLWGDDNFFNARNMDVYISKLRKHLEKDKSLEIINVRGVGFKLIM